ncbi:MAG TPA: hypothetical protein VJG30_01495 [Candidatus Nanoarchaeia archaeon]|nr:hypothetical protein [Candidatus Nanoarchaeia archaeon]
MERLKLYKLGLSYSEIQDLLNDKKKRGWVYVDIMDEDDRYDQGMLKYIITPSKKQWTFQDCKRVLEGRLEFGNLNQIEALKVLDFINLIYNYHGRHYLG